MDEMGRPVLPMPEHNLVLGRYRRMRMRVLGRVIRRPGMVVLGHQLALAIRVEHQSVDMPVTATIPEMVAVV
jgi:hypothetical protein